MHNRLLVARYTHFEITLILSLHAGAKGSQLVIVQLRYTEVGEVTTFKILATRLFVALILETTITTMLQHTYATYE